MPKADKETMKKFRNREWLLRRMFKGNIMVDDYVWGRYLSVWSDKWTVVHINSAGRAVLKSECSEGETSASATIPLDDLAGMELEEL